MNHRQSVSRRRLLQYAGLAGTGAALSTSFLTTPAVAQDSIELEFMFWGGLLEKEGLENAMRKFNEANPGIEVSGQHVPRDGYETKINTIMGAGTLPDIAHLPEGLALRWAAEGRILDLTSYLDTHPTFSSRLPSSFYYYEPGKTIGTMNAVEIMCLYSNRQVFEESGIDLPPVDGATALDWDQFIELAASLTIDRNGRRATEDGFDPGNIGQFGYSFYAWWGGWYPLLTSGGGDITNEDGTQCTINSPESVAVFQAIQDSMYVHHVCPTITQQGTLADTVTRLATKQVAMVMDGQWALLDLAPSPVDIHIGVLPKFVEPKPVLMGPLTAIFSDTEHPDEAFDFWLFHNDPVESPELYQQGLWMPLESKYYTDPEFMAIWIDNDAHPEEYRQSVVDYTYQYGTVSPAIRLRNWDAIDSIVGSGLGTLWSGERSAQDVLDDIAEELQPVLQGVWPES